MQKQLIELFAPPVIALVIAVSYALALQKGWGYLQAAGTSATASFVAGSIIVAIGFFSKDGPGGDLFLDAWREAGSAVFAGGLLIIAGLAFYAPVMATIAAGIGIAGGLGMMWTGLDEIFEEELDEDYPQFRFLLMPVGILIAFIADQPGDHGRAWAEVILLSFLTVQLLWTLRVHHGDYLRQLRSKLAGG